MLKSHQYENQNTIVYIDINLLTSIENNFFTGKMKFDKDDKQCKCAMTMTYTFCMKMRGNANKLS